MTSLLLNIAAILVLLVGPVMSPAEYFGSSYTEAVEFCHSNRNEFLVLQKQYNLDPKIASAVVLPELVRYSRFFDFMETTTLELAYVKGGSSVSDFSIGRFQMKPSFVEMLETELRGNPQLMLEFNELVDYPPSIDDKEVRRIRLSRLKDQQWQFKYLACFISLAQIRFTTIIDQQPNKKLLILSSAYNLGLSASYEDLLRISKTKTLPFGNVYTGRFSYFEVANHYYLNHSPKIF